MQTVTVADLTAAIRSEADIETSDQANAVVTDADILVYINAAYRELFDLIGMDRGREAFKTSASVGPSAWTVPADFYRVLAIDFSPTVPATQFSFRARNLASALSGYPQWRITAGAIEWRPANPTAAVTLWYIPTPAALGAMGSFNAFNGWDEFVIQSAVRRCKVKQEESTSDAERLLGEARARVDRAAASLNYEPETVVDVRGGSYVDEFGLRRSAFDDFFNS